MVSEQLATFIASVSLFVAAKYSEIKYPVVDDVCVLMNCPFSFDEFIEMEREILMIFDWNLQLPTSVEILSNFLTQGILFQSDEIIITDKQADTHQKISLLALDDAHLQKTIKKVRQLTEFFADRVIYDASLTIG